MMLDVSILMSDPDFRQPFQILRAGPAVLDASGLLQDPGYATIQFAGVVQPASPADLDVLPEGTNLKGVISVWAAQELRCDDGDGRLSDVVVWNGQRYRGIKVEDRSRDGGYYRLFAQEYNP